MIRIKRKHAMIDLLRAYRVLINDQEVGRIKNGKECEYAPQCGTHCLQLQIDWRFSNPVEFDFKDELIEFECGNDFHGMRAILGVLNVFGSRGEYLWLKR